MKSVWTLTTFNLRLKRGFLLAWIVPLLAIVLVFPLAYFDYYPTLDERQGVVQGMQNNTGTRAIYGLIREPGTVGQMTTWEAAMWVGLLGSIMVVLLIVDIHRRREYTAIAELIRSTGTPRMAPWAAATLTGIISAFIVGLGSTGILIALQTHIDEITTKGSIAFGLTQFLAITGSMLLAQLVLGFISDGAALGKTALMTVAISYGIRIIADTQDISWLNWFSPLGWRELISAFTDDNFGNAAIAAGICLGLMLITGALERHREYATGIARLPHRAPRSKPVHGPLHLRWRLTRGGLVAWLVIIAITSAILLALSGDIAELVGGDDTTGEVFRDLLGGTDAFEAFIAYICQMVTITIAAAGIQQVTAYRREELTRTADLQRSTGLRRWVPLGATAVVANASLVVMVAVMHSAGAFGLYTQDSTLGEDYTSLAQASWSLLAPAVLLTGIAVAIVGIAPLGTQWAWAPLAFSAAVTLMGEILQLPEWLIDLSPLGHPQTPGTDEWWIPALMLTIGFVLNIAGLISAQRREIR
ncbi:hypothetical protein QP027_11395 [Corynebacterium breve]|uniref:ABC transporter permease n=1 Tax=Corynebacterium breve TaxID=3049799 RepID=A0ABY8VFD1_9CORY|nr:hypothetical protein [Corynebacterium breve]WIM67671.1 hypothetical protein QP027_11395 [Corynebacterium breve]